MTRIAHRAARRRSPWGPLAFAAAGAAVLILSGQGVWATLNATATTSTPQTVTSGSLTLTMAPTGVGLTQSISGLAPGDVVNRHVVLTNGGNLTLSGTTFGVTASVPGSTLVTDTATTKALKITVNRCTVAWTATTGVCGGTSTVAVTQRALSVLAANPVTLANAPTAVGDKTYLQISLQLPEQDEVSTNGVGPATTVQNQTVSLTYTFTAGQRAATTTNS
ncbi:MAG: TasA family protein [Sporichthyaceae bacterium]